MEDLGEIDARQVLHQVVGALGDQGETVEAGEDLERLGTEALLAGRADRGHVLVPVIVECVGFQGDDGERSADRIGQHRDRHAAPRRRHHIDAGKDRAGHRDAHETERHVECRASIGTLEQLMDEGHGQECVARRLDYVERLADVLKLAIERLRDHLTIGDDPVGRAVDDPRHGRREHRRQLGRETTAGLVEPLVGLGEMAEILAVLVREAGVLLQLLRPLSDAFTSAVEERQHVGAGLAEQRQGGAALGLLVRRVLEGLGDVAERLVDVLHVAGGVAQWDLHGDKQRRHVLVLAGGGVEHRLLELDEALLHRLGLDAGHLGAEAPDREILGRDAELFGAQGQAFEALGRRLRHGDQAAQGRDRADRPQRGQPRRDRAQTGAKLGRHLVDGSADLAQRLCLGLGDGRIEGLDRSEGRLGGAPDLAEDLGSEILAENLGRDGKGAHAMPPVLLRQRCSDAFGLPQPFHEFIYGCRQNRRRRRLPPEPGEVVDRPVQSFAASEGGFNSKKSWSFSRQSCMSM